MKEKSENFNSLRSILFELCKKNYRGGGKLTPPRRNRVKCVGGDTENKPTSVPEPRFKRTQSFYFAQEHLKSE